MALWGRCTRCSAVDWGERRQARLETHRCATAIAVRLCSCWLCFPATHAQRSHVGVDDHRRRPHRDDEGAAGQLLAVGGAGLVALELVVDQKGREAPRGGAGDCWVAVGVWGQIALGLRWGFGSDCVWRERGVHAPLRTPSCPPCRTPSCQPCRKSRHQCEKGTH
jgi:hypothetical protein